MFLHREFSLEPYSRHYSHERNCLLDFLTVDDFGKVTVKDEYQGRLGEVLGKYNHAKDANALLKLPFTSLPDYLHMLRAVCGVLAEFRVGPSALIYLAAAVSDFFIPLTDLAEHKIQSREGPLEIKMDPVPKMLRALVKEWAPEAFVVSFKLETDPELLLAKARGALSKYGHQLVVGNILNTRKRTVTMVPADAKEYPVSLTDEQVSYWG